MDEDYRNIKRMEEKELFDSWIFKMLFYPTKPFIYIYMKVRKL